MAETPCGCEQYRDAQTARPGEREALLRVCGGSAAKWACPRAGHSGEPDARNAISLRQIEVLTGCERGALRRCPGLEIDRTDVAQALRLYRAQQSGGLNFNDDPPAAIVLASEVIGASDARRLDREQEERERKSGGQ